MGDWRIEPLTRNRADDASVVLGRAFRDNPGPRAVLRERDAGGRDGVIAYLETDAEENVRLYERFGYRVTSDSSVPSLPELRIWTMTRPAPAR